MALGKGMAGIVWGVFLGGGVLKQAWWVCLGAFWLAAPDICHDSGEGQGNFAMGERRHGRVVGDAVSRSGFCSLEFRH